MIASGLRSESRERKSALLLMLSGWRIGKPHCKADCLMGEETSSRPRPFGRSGCVTTRGTWKPPSTSLSSVGTAKPGVPQNTRLKEWDMARTWLHGIIESLTQSLNDLPFSRFNQFADLALD